MQLSGSPADFITAFLGGLLVSLSPCVYPLIPVTVGFLGINAAGSKFKGFGLGLIYVTGIALTYSILGLLASVTGTLFGSISAHPLTRIFFGLVIVACGISLFGVFQINLPYRITLPIFAKKGYAAAFLLGLSSGLIIGPCVTPVLGAILVYLSIKKNILYGMLLLLSFAYGMGLILILVSTFSGLLVSLPKSGKWMLYLKKAAALVFLGLGLYFIISGIGRWLE